MLAAEGFAFLKIAFSSFFQIFFYVFLYFFSIYLLLLYGYYYYYSIFAVRGFTAANGPEPLAGTGRRDQNSFSPGDATNS